MCRGLFCVATTRNVGQDLATFGDVGDMSATRRRHVELRTRRAGRGLSLLREWWYDFSLRRGGRWWRAKCKATISTRDSNWGGCRCSINHPSSLPPMGATRTVWIMSCAKTTIYLMAILHFAVKIAGEQVLHSSLKLFGNIERPILN